METYSIAQIARETKIPDSTLRYWRERFKDFLPSEGKGRATRYHKESIAVFATIRDLNEEGIPFDQIPDRLSQQFQRTYTIESEDGMPIGKKNELEKYKQGIVPMIESFIESQDRLTEAFENQTKVQERTLNVVEEQAKVLGSTTSLLKEIRSELNAVDENIKLKEKLDAAIDRTEKMKKQKEHLVTEIARPLSLKERLTGKREDNRNKIATKNNAKQKGNKKATAQA